MCWVSWCLIDPSRWVSSGQVRSAAPGRRWQHLPCTARDFIISPFLCLALPEARRRAPENSASSTFSVICCLYTKIRGGEGGMVLPFLPHLPPSLPRKSGCALSGPHTNGCELLMVTGRAHLLNVRAGVGVWKSVGVDMRATQACSKECESVSRAADRQLVPEDNTQVFCYFLPRSCK